MNIKEFKNVLSVVSCCPRSFNQNHKDIFKNHEDGWKYYCHEEGGFKDGCFMSCPMWDKRMNCWFVYSQSKKKR